MDRLTKLYCRGQDHAAYGWAPFYAADSAGRPGDEIAAYRLGFNDYRAGFVVDQRKIAANETREKITGRLRIANETGGEG